ncbi:sensor histidine kinase [Pseudomonas vancouverensis]|uniref:histidine kinase n=1 Tax=Pseudomonas vancouverensis TaxID=95300 RepID=A0A1H2PDG7_PSEVA|nr:HAMP domain-containing sensor histidine kinase [Pseudomonas vancouverensis]KAB0497905.1 HAMP domain-containing histidine kinase [Pseudomonas vancouverensis]TDB66632.1 HAMP domain-containing histidine kinase [Pseudomonas vancouverensis]SDV15753.1 Histidine kinase-, DNA gyrase B-, and HSP90-like ATPase [Pseudomonas vancouverensis]
MNNPHRQESREPSQVQRLFRQLLREWLWISLVLLPLTALLSYRTQMNLADATPGLSALLSVGLVTGVLGLLLWRPHWALWITLIGMACALLTSAGLAELRKWWSPTPAFLSILFGYLIWNWRRLNGVLTYFGWELARLDSEPKVFPERRRPRFSGGDRLQGQIMALEQAMSRTRDTHRFIADGLEYLPVATLISDPRGQILLGNRKARELFEGDLVGDDVRQQLVQLGYPHVSQDLDALLSTLPLLEFRDIKERSLRLERAELLPVGGEAPVGWLWSLTDLSVERDAEEQRALMLRFLSHDLRAPHSAILALLDVHRHQVGGDPQLFDQIERQVRRALDLTDGFVQLARAESESYQLQPSLFAMLVLDVFDQALPIAQQKQIELFHDVDELAQESLIMADQSLLTRALFNLLENAIKYSAKGTCVSLQVTQHDDWLTCELADQGKGIAAEELPELFSQYRRFSSAQGIDGVGLGLSMVKAVVDRHGGTIECLSEVGKGTRFVLRFPIFKEY